MLIEDSPSVNTAPLWLPSLDTPGPCAFSLAPKGRKISVYKTRGKGQAGQKPDLEDQAMWRTQHSLCWEPTWALPVFHLAAICALPCPPGHRPGIQTQRESGTSQRGDPNRSEVLCCFCYPILLAREWFSRKWKVLKELFLNMTLPQHLPCLTKTVMLGQQNRAGHTRNSTFFPTLMAVVKGWKNAEEEG